MRQEIVIMKLSEVKEHVKRRWRSRHIQTNPICIVSHTGMGKTQAMHQAAKELTEELEKTTKQNVECKVVNLQFCEAPDFMGLPYVDSEGFTRHARPTLIPDSGYGLLFLDEVNRCQRDIRQALISLILQRHVNGHKLGDGWTIVMAMNPLEADGVAYEVYEFDAALEARISKAEFKGDVQEFTDYMVKKYTAKHPVVRWIINQPEIVDFKGQKRTNPRGLENTIFAIAADNEGVIDSKNTIIFETTALELGVEAATVFRKFLVDSTNVKAEDVIDNFNDELANKIKTLEEDGRNDILQALINNVAMLISIRKPEEMQKKQLDNFVKYQELVDAESKMAIWLALGEKGLGDDYFNRLTEYTLKNSTVMREFCKKHNMEQQREETVTKTNKTSKKA